MSSLKTSVPRPGTCGRSSYGYLPLVFLGGWLLTAVAAAGAADWREGERPFRSHGLPAAGLSPELARGSVSDPIGDTFGQGPVQIDITSFSADVVGNDLVIQTTFAGNISPPDSGQPNAIDGFIDIDTDQDPATGRLPHVDDERPDLGSTGMGNEFFVDLFTYDSADGSADLVDDLSELTMGRVPVFFNANSFSVTVPLNLLGDEGAVNAATILGTIDGPTDLAPNQGSVSSANAITLHNDRFEANVDWADFDGNQGLGKVVSQSDESAVLYFFTPDNWEMVLKVLDGCDINGRYWVFFAAATNVELTVAVTDTQTGNVKQYTNPLGQPAAAVLDTQAFATCP